MNNTSILTLLVILEEGSRIRKGVKTRASVRLLQLRPLRLEFWYNIYYTKTLREVRLWSFEYNLLITVKKFLSVLYLPINL